MIFKLKITIIDICDDVKIDIDIILSTIILILIKLRYMSGTMKYEMMILLTEEFNDSELKTWAFNYAKALQKFKCF